MPVDTLTLDTVQHLPNFKKKTRTEYSASCPQCGGIDRFLFWEDKLNFYCRQCGVKGFVSDGNTLTFDREAWLKWQAQETERKRQEYQEKLSTLEKLQQSNKVEIYCQQLMDRSFWYGKGLTDETIDWFELGYCPSCPTAPGRESYTIPVTYQGKLYNIRHRLVNSDDKGKYRPEMAGLPSAMFNADILHSSGGYVVVVEGEVKSLVLTQWKIDAVGIPGANNFKSKWLNLFPKNKIVYIALDPGAEEQALNIGRMFKAAGIPVRVCRFKVKPDDFLVIGENDKEDFMRVLRKGRNLV